MRASSAIVRQSRKENSREETELHHFLLLCTFARGPAGALLFSLI